jgi:hypothetical protein
MGRGLMGGVEKSTVMLWTSGGGWFWTGAPLPHPARAAIIATGRRERIHRFVTTVNLLELYAMNREMQSNV